VLREPGHQETQQGISTPRLLVLGSSQFRPSERRAVTSTRLQACLNNICPWPQPLVHPYAMLKQFMCLTTHSHPLMMPPGNILLHLGGLPAML